MASRESRRAACDGSWVFCSGMGNILIVLACIALAGLPACAQDSVAASPKFLGAQSCSSTSCHGGAGNNKDQYLVWFKYDYHHARPFATLETARAERIAEILKIGDPARSASCTVCHAPFQTLPVERMIKTLAPSEGVSCESCHGPAESWLRSHTRHDWTHENRVKAGMRDLENLYVRANTCVACHQTLDSNIRKAGHPELIFELDGQAVTQPKHWLATHDKPGPQIWLVGQAIALREMSWHLSRETTHDPETVASCDALVWLLQQVTGTNSSALTTQTQSFEPTKERLEEIRNWSDRIGKESASSKWSSESTRKLLALLARSDDAFANGALSIQILARRGERLVLALDRLVTSFGDSGISKETNAALERLYDDVQSLPDFDPKQFVKDLQKFHATLRESVGSN